jgi:peroxiredoxin (alkyl hydroperoxide reductase subunit C)
MKKHIASLLTLVILGLARPLAASETNVIVFNPGPLKPVDSHLKMKVGDRAPDFKLPCVKGGEVSLKQFRGKKNVVISFAPAAFTPICSAQWPGYDLVRDVFAKHDAVLLGISTDNIPSLYAWNQEMGGISFDILSDFYPHGQVASSFGVLRTDGMAERALFIIDKQGIIRYADVHDINQRPPLEDLVAALDKLPE